MGLKYFVIYDISGRIGCDFQLVKKIELCTILIYIYIYMYIYIYIFLTVRFRRRKGYS